MACFPFVFELCCVVGGSPTTCRRWSDGLFQETRYCYRAYAMAVVSTHRPGWLSGPVTLGTLLQPLQLQDMQCIPLMKNSAMHFGIIPPLCNVVGHRRTFFYYCYIINGITSTKISCLLIGWYHSLVGCILLTIHTGPNFMRKKLIKLNKYIWR